MIKKVVFNVLLNILLIAAVAIGVTAYKAQNYFVPIVCAAAFALTLFYKIRLSKQVRQEMKLKAEENIAKKQKTQKPANN